MDGEQLSTLDRAGLGVTQSLLGVINITQN